MVDFIDMRHRRDQQAVYRAMKERLKRDKAKTQVLQISSVGLMEMTRQRLNESLLDSTLEPCTYCQGRARIKTTMSMSIEIQRRLNTVIQRQKENDEDGDLIVMVNTDVLNRFKSEDSKILMEKVGAVEMHVLGFVDADQTTQSGEKVNDSSRFLLDSSARNPVFPIEDTGDAMPAFEKRTFLST